MTTLGSTPVSHKTGIWGYNEHRFTKTEVKVQKKTGLPYQRNLAVNTNQSEHCSLTSFICSVLIWWKSQTSCFRNNQTSSSGPNNHSKDICLPDEVASQCILYSKVVYLSRNFEEWKNVAHVQSLVWLVLRLVQCLWVRQPTLLYGIQWFTQAGMCGLCAGSEVIFSLSPDFYWWMGEKVCSLSLWQLIKLQLSKLN